MQLSVLHTLLQCNIDSTLKNNNTLLLICNCAAQVLHQWFVCGRERVVGLFVWDEPLCLGMYGE